MFKYATKIKQTKIYKQTNKTDFNPYLNCNFYLFSGKFFLQFECVFIEWPENKLIFTKTLKIKKLKNY